MGWDIFGEILNDVIKIYINSMICKKLICLYDIFAAIRDWKYNGMPGD
jgi:hypothetical protein